MPNQTKRHRAATTVDPESPLNKGWPPPWCVSFADITTILMSAFLLWYSLTAINIPSDLLAIKTGKRISQKEMEIFKDKGTVDTASRIVEIIKKVAPKQELELLKELDELKKLEKKLIDYINTQGISSILDVEGGIKGVMVILRSDVLFNEGEVELKEEVLPVLDKVVELLKSQPYFQAQITGHTDTKLIDPFHRYRYPSNWELSYARALSVARYFISKGVPPGSLGVMGYGQERPKFPNDSEENMAKNRRIEISILFSKSSPS